MNGGVITARLIGIYLVAVIRRRKEKKPGLSGQEGPNVSTSGDFYFFFKIVHERLGFYFFFILFSRSCILVWGVSAVVMVPLEEIYIYVASQTVCVFVCLFILVFFSVCMPLQIGFVCVYVSWRYLFHLYVCLLEMLCFICISDETSLCISVSSVFFFFCNIFMYVYSMPLHVSFSCVWGLPYQFHPCVFSGSVSPVSTPSWGVSLIHLPRISSTLSQIYKKKELKLVT